MKVKRDKHQTVSTLWVGSKSLPIYAIMCLNSFLQHGHKIQLFTYHEIDNVPEGVVIRDANEVMSFEKIYLRKDLYQNYNIAIFSDIFRLALFGFEDTFWVDIDVICISDEIPSDPIYLCYESVYDYASYASGGAAKFPKDSNIVKNLCKMAKDNTNILEWDSLEKIKEKTFIRRHLKTLPERRSILDWR